ncbi:GntP family permease [Demequina capsici]|uniref:H+/gluconate symporter n=1 Tax=Demequina capsici TaxID=3075620 RepID=A0AA96F472_9MICO|nr:hypothetical protein [Demequina sp. OYTSA14]WNM23598.1 hypothetical protein RN606_09495 [Demequina sp. OYTSA14]
MLIKRVPVPIAALATVVLLAVLTGADLMNVISEDYLGTVASFIKANWLVLLTGVTLSRVMEMTGAATAVANVIAKRLGARGVIPTIMLSGALLAYGGIDGLALVFVLYPIALDMFRGANIPRSFIPAVLTSSLFTWVMCLPGSPVVTNFNAARILGTTAMAGAIPGLAAAAVIIAMQLLYFNWALKRAAARGEVFVADDETKGILAHSDEMAASGSLPNPILSLTPIVTVFVAYNVFHAELWVSMLAGTLACLAVLFKKIKGFGGVLTQSTNQAAQITIIAGSVVGIGGVIGNLPGFNDLVGSITSFASSGGNPLLAWSGATIILSGLLTNGMVGLITVLQTLSQTFLDLGVAPEALHRVGVIASAVLDTLPYGGGVVAIFTLTRIPYKEAYKHVAWTSFIPMLTGLAVAIILCGVMY